MNWNPWMVVPVGYVAVVAGIIIWWRWRERRWEKQEANRGVRELVEWLREH